MTDNTSNTDANALMELDIKELRKRAASVYRISVTKDMDKNDIVQLILEKEKKTTFAKVVDGRSSDRPAPGWARIFINKDPNPGASNRPIYWHINGRRFCVPRGIQVDVPIKLVDGPMRDARESRLVEDVGEAVNSVHRFKWELQQSYPWHETMRTEGPDPFPGDEIARAARRKPEHDFAQKFGYWPRSAELKEWLKQSLAKA